VNAELSLTVSGRKCDIAENGMKKEAPNACSIAIE
jgi:hypothetical protein